VDEFEADVAAEQGLPLVGDAGRDGPGDRIDAADGGDAERDAV